MVKHMTTTRPYLALQVVCTRSGFTFPAGELVLPAQLAPDEVDSLLARRFIELAPEQYRAGTIEAFDGPGAPACSKVT